MSTTLRALYQSNSNFNPKFVETLSFKKDYLNVCSDLSLVELLIDQGDTDPNGACLSDDVDIYANNKQKERV